MKPKSGHKIIGKIKRVKGKCTVGHKEGEEFELSAYYSNGLCGYLYHDIFPYILMLQYGGEFPIDWWGSTDSIVLI